MEYNLVRNREQTQRCDLLSSSEFLSRIEKITTSGSSVHHSPAIPCEKNPQELLYVQTLLLFAMNDSVAMNGGERTGDLTTECDALFVAEVTSALNVALK